MKRSNSILDNLIKDFDLASPGDGSICFRAVIQYESVGHYKQLESEVHVIHIRNRDLAVLYLLEPDLVKQNIPDMLYFDQENFTYHPHIAMEVKGKDKNGNYSITITPIERNCNEATIAELYAKANN